MEFQRYVLIIAVLIVGLVHGYRVVQMKQNHDSNETPKDDAVALEHGNQGDSTFQDGAATVDEHGNRGNRTFRYEVCDRIPSPIKILYLDVTPDPLEIGQNITVKFQVQLDGPIGRSPIEVDFDWKMKIDGEWVEMCDFIGYKNCYKQDVCPYFPSPVQCPAGPGPTPKITISRSYTDPPFRIFGSFETTFILRENGKDIKCLKLWFSVRDDRT